MNYATYYITTFNINDKVIKKTKKYNYKEMNTLIIYIY